MVADLLRSVPMFSTLTSESLEQLAARGHAVTVKAGDHLFHADDPSDSMYVVESGRLEVLMVDEAGPLLARVLTRGAVVGDLGVLTGAPRSASVRARRDSELIRIDGEDFERLLEEGPGFAIEVSRALGRALQASRGVAAETSPTPTTISLIGLGSDAPVVAVCDRLSHWLGSFGSLSTLRTDERDTSDEVAIARWLDEREQQGDKVLLVAAPSDPPSWHDFCVRQADRVLALVDGPPDGRRAARPELEGCDLVSYTGRGAVAVGRWLEQLEPRAVYTVGTVAAEPSVGEPLAGIARRLAGRSVGIALSGGGARGSAHIGVFEALLDAGVLVDRVAGCSIGALAAAAFASGLSPREMAEGWHRDMVATNPLSDYTVPVVAVVRGAKLMAGLRNQFGIARIEDLPREFGCISSDIYSGQPYVHRRGPLVDAVYASMAIPGLLPPARVDGRVLVDGGVLNNLPVQTLQTRDEGPVIAVNLTLQSPGSEAPATAADPLDRRRGRGIAAMLQNTITGGHGPAPPLRETLMRALLLGSVDATRVARTTADVVITPDTRGIALLDFGALNRGREAGHAAALEALSEPENRERLGLE